MPSVLQVSPCLHLFNFTVLTSEKTILKFFFSLRSHRIENPGELERGFALIRLSGLEKERNCLAVLRENEFSASP